VRRVQDLRKSAGFEIEDRIATHYSASENLARAISEFGEYIRAETLSVELQPGSPPAGASIAQDEFDGEKVTLGIAKAKARSAKVGNAKNAKKTKAAKVKRKAKNVKSAKAGNAKSAKGIKAAKGSARKSRKIGKGTQAKR
jgi:hypothetical protein